MTIPVLMPTYSRCEVEPVEGDGAYLIGKDGKRYLDFASGIAVNCLGHSHPHLIKTIQDQAAKLMHTSNLYSVPGQWELAQRLVDLTFADTVFFTNSGVEAFECAAKTALAYQHVTGNTDRSRIITFNNAFHGRSIAAISATGSEKLRVPFEPLPDWSDHAPFNDLDAVKALISDKTAGIMVEPIQGEGGILPATQEFLQGLRDLCDEHHLMLIFDEVQCGVARTGTLFAYEQYGVTPDIMAIAKGIGGGFPLGACLASEKAAVGMTVGTHGSTYGGNPLGMAAGQAVLDVVAEPDFLEQVREKGERLRQALEQFIPNHDDLFESVRGRGLMLGVRMTEASRPFVNFARQYGILLVAAGDNVVRVLPPLNIEEEHIRECVEKLSTVANAYREAKKTGDVPA
ncbi:acetylornithine transaminase [Pacificimonas flava]|uniref:Acetylornithine aminotransferase n=2 Tax=Pacificimonas TaxID=1960290 RepID=A0A219B0I4_9SPHN|nr:MULTISPECIES: aspartate aminotransferase family protein [Pacificimonas]MBZ6379705.1 aspartate aminotransferase family protein [Pacificimonas aurantium]OWV31835.1 acetylornithine transaminase [Pacificimonas flava]